MGSFGAGAGPAVARGRAEHGARERAERGPCDHVGAQARAKQHLDHAEVGMMKTLVVRNPVAPTELDSLLTDLLNSKPDDPRWAKGDPERPDGRCG